MGPWALITRKVNRTCFHFKKKYQNISSFHIVLQFPFLVRGVVDVTHLVLILLPQVQIIFSQPYVHTSGYGTILSRYLENIPSAPSFFALII